MSSPNDRDMLRNIAEALLRVLDAEAPTRTQKRAAPETAANTSERTCTACKERFTARMPWMKLCPDCFALKRRNQEARGDPPEDPGDLPVF